MFDPHAPVAPDRSAAGCSGRMIGERTARPARRSRAEASATSPSGRARPRRSRPRRGPATRAAPSGSRPPARPTHLRAHSPPPGRYSSMLYLLGRQDSISRSMPSSSSTCENWDPIAGSAADRPELVAEALLRYRHRLAAGHRVLVQHEHAHAAMRQQRRAGSAADPRPHHDRVVPLGHRLPSPGRSPISDGGMPPCRS